MLKIEQKSPARNRALKSNSQLKNSTEAYKRQVLDEAISLTHSGFSIILAEGKKPIGAWQKHQKQAMSETALKNSLRLNPSANIAIVTGRISNIFVLDIDGLEGEESIRQLEQQHGALTPSVEVITGGGGRHVYYWYPRNFDIRNSAGKLGNKIDVRGEGGYVICPPSVHPSGRQYEWSVDCTKEIAQAPLWLLKLITSPQERRAITPASDWVELIQQGVREGGRNDAIARMSGMLLRKDLDPYITLELCHAWNESRCTPPLEQAEITTIVNSIAGAELNRRQGVKNNG